MYQKLGRYDDAVRVYLQSIQRNPSGPAYSNLGTSYYSAGHFREAAAAFEKATQLEPSFCVYWRNLGDASRWVPGAEAKARQAFERAIELCDEAISVNPKDSAAHTSRATALAKLGRHREARVSILRALELAPQSDSVIYEAAVIANLDGSEEEALARLEQALRLSATPDDMLRDPEFANLRKSGRLQAIIAGYRSTPQR
jgi:Flp pilus assembly protein TadD